MFKRAMINVLRQPVKSICLLLLFTFLGGILLTGISISRSMIATEERLLMQVPAVATLVYDGNAIFGWGQPTREEITSVGNLPYVRAYDFTLRTHFYSEQLLWIDSMDPGYLTGRGVNNPNITDIESGLISLIEGRIFTQEEIDDNAMVMVIPQSFALVNNLSAGSRIEIANIAHDYRWMGDWSDRFYEDFILEKRLLEFEVIGIFGSQVEYGEDAYFVEPILFYMPFGVAESMLDFETQAMIEADEETFRALGQGILQEEPFLETLFVLYSPRDLEMFSSVSSELLPDDWTIAGIDESIFAPIVNSMDMVLELAHAIQLITIVASVFVLTLVLLLFFHDRRFEIGIYMALGSKKIKVIFQILMEVGIIAMLGIVLAIFVGNISSASVSNYLLEQHLIEQMEIGHSHFDVIPWELTLHVPGQMTIEEALELYDVALDIEMILIFAGMGIFAVLVSTIVPIWYVLKLEPKALLQ